MTTDAPALWVIAVAERTQSAAGGRTGAVCVEKRAGCDAIGRIRRIMRLICVISVRYERIMTAGSPILLVA